MKKRKIRVTVTKCLSDKVIQLYNSEEKPSATTLGKMLDISLGKCYGKYSFF